MVSRGARGVVALVVALAVLGIFAASLAWLLDTPPPPRGAGRAERLYIAYCAYCHGEDGRGSWRATLFLIRPGDLADPARIAETSDQYLFDIIKHGGAPIGRPGMPGFPHLADADIEALVGYIRDLAARPPGGPARTGERTVPATLTAGGRSGAGAGRSPPVGR